MELELKGTRIKTPVLRLFGGERDHYGQKSRFGEWKVAIKPGMLPQTT